jgi:hypothetical protein
MKAFLTELPEIFISFTHWENVCGNEPAVSNCQINKLSIME